MEIAVISDLHLGISDAADQFEHDDYEFIKFVKFLERNFEKIILLGDICETLMATRYFASRKSLLSKCIAAHRELFDRFMGTNKYKYIFGNHDVSASSVLKASENLELDLDGQHILFCHGHQYDYFLQKWRVASEIGTWAGGWLNRAGLSPVYKMFRSADESEDPRFQNLAFDSAKEKHADIIVTGHTHVATTTRRDNKLYLNSGTCSNGRINFLSMNTKTAEYKTNNSW